jgi:Fe-S-cluster containining protein
VIDALLSEKGNLYKEDSLFRCDDACLCDGCRGDLVVSVSLPEIWAQAKYLCRPVLEVFDHYCCTVPFVEHNLGAARVRFALRKPCLFLNHAGYCTVYAVRPAACALFPEFLSLRTDRDDCVKDMELDSYPCVEHLPDVPEARKDALTRLAKIHQEEIYGGEIYLFGHAGFTVDLREEVSRICVGRPGEVVPFSVQTEALRRLLNTCGWWGRIRQKIQALDAAEGQEIFFSGMEIVAALNL